MHDSQTDFQDVTKAWTYHYTRNQKDPKSGGEYFRRTWLRAQCDQYDWKITDEESAENSQATAVKYILQDQKLSRYGQHRMLELMEDPAKRESYVNMGGWTHDEAERMLYEHMECSMEVVQMCFEESPKRMNRRKAGNYPTLMPEGTKRRKAEVQIKIKEKAAEE